MSIIFNRRQNPAVGSSVVPAAFAMSIAATVCAVLLALLFLGADRAYGATAQIVSDDTENGTVSVSSVTVSDGSVFGPDAPAALPNSDFEFEGWYVHGERIGATLAETEVQDGAVYVAHFTRPTFGLETFSGSTRFETATLVASSFAEQVVGCDGVIVANGWGFADALVASSLSGILGYPILYTAQDSLSAETADQITALGVTHVIIMGGTAAVSADVERDVLALLERNGADPDAADTVQRVFGSSRYDTANQAFLSQDISDFGSTLVIATGDSFPDALSVAPFCASGKAPLFLANKGSLDSQTLEILSRAAATGHFDRVLIVGGTSAVSDDVEQQMAGLFSEVVRKAGDSRYDTSAQLAEWLVGNAGMTYDRMGVASGENYPDGLAGAALLGASDSVLMLVENTDGAREGYRSLIANDKLSSNPVRVFGGTSRVDQLARDELSQHMVYSAQEGSASDMHLWANAGEVYLYAGPSTTTSIMGARQQNDLFNAASYNDAWASVPLEGGGTGYLRKADAKQVSSDATYIQVDIVADDEANGTVSPATLSSVSDEPFGPINPTVTPSEGNLFEGWYLHGQSLGTDMSEVTPQPGETFFAHFTRPSFGLETYSGAHRYETAALIADGYERFAGSYDGVIIASGANYPDALVASGLSGMLGYPVLLTATDSLSEDAAMRIQSSGATKAVIIGGTGAVSEAVENAVRDLLEGNGVVEPLSEDEPAAVQDNPTETGQPAAGEPAGIEQPISEQSAGAEAQAQSVEGDAALTDGVAGAATQGDSPASADGSGNVAAEQEPLEVADGSSDTAVEGDSSAAAAGFASDGNAVEMLEATDDAAADVQTLSLADLLEDDSVVRIAGESRTATACQALRSYGFDEWGDTIVLVTGENFPDALSIAPYCAYAKVPLLLAGKDGSIDDETASLLAEAAESHVSRLLIVGGTSAVSDDVEQQMAELFPEVVRKAGDNRYDTSDQLAEWLVSEEGMSYDRMGVATGNSYPDGLAGAALLGASGSVLMLTDATDAGRAPYRALIEEDKLSDNPVRIFGGTGAVDELAREELSRRYVTDPQLYSMRTTYQIYVQTEHLVYAQPSTLSDIKGVKAAGTVTSGAGFNDTWLRVTADDGTYAYMKNSNTLTLPLADNYGNYLRLITTAPVTAYTYPHLEAPVFRSNLYTVGSLTEALTYDAAGEWYVQWIDGVQVYVPASQLRTLTELEAYTYQIMYENNWFNYDLYQCFEWVAAHPYISIGSPDLYGTNDWADRYALGFFQRGGGDCYSFAGAFCILARSLGYNAQVHAGYSPTRSGSPLTHGWVEIYIDGVTYVCDPDLELEAPGYNWYMVTYESAPIGYIR